MKKILLIGGGTGGHIYPLKNLAEALLKKNFQVHILVSDSELDRKILNENFDSQKIHFHFLKTGKIRRYLSFQNIKDSFQILKAIFWCRKFIKIHKFDYLFFKGGFVGFPILVASKFFFPRFSGKIFSHESDISAGLLTRFSSYFADKIFYSFGKNSYPLFFSTNEFSQIKKTKTPQILIFGGSQGANFINDLILQLSSTLLEKYKLLLVTGLNKSIFLPHKNFEQFELLKAANLSKKIQESDLIISRGGANSLFEILEQKKKSIIIPLPSSARNHQMENAQYFEKQNLVKILKQNTQTSKKLIPLIQSVLQDELMQEKLRKSNIKNQAKKIAEAISRR